MSTRVKQLNTPENPILLIEDDPLTARLICQMIYSIDSKMKVDWVGSAELATQKMERNSYRVIICDHFLSGASTGLEMWHLCRNSYAKNSVFILMSSHSKMQVQLDLGTDEDFPDFVQKPLRVMDLSRITESLRTAA